MVHSSVMGIFRLLLIDLGKNSAARNASAFQVEAGRAP